MINVAVILHRAFGQHCTNAPAQGPDGIRYLLKNKLNTTKEHTVKTQTKNLKCSKELEGLWIDNDLLYNADLNPSDRILMSYVRFRASRQGEYWAHDKTASHAIGISPATVKRSLRKLKDLGLLEGQKGNGKRIQVRMAPNWYAKKNIPDGKNMRDLDQNELRDTEAQNAPDENQADPCGSSPCTHAEAQSEPHIRLKLDSKTKEEDEDNKSYLPKSSSSSSLLLTEDTENRKASDTRSPLTEEAQLVKRLQHEALQWARQVAYRAAYSVLMKSQESTPVGDEKYKPSRAILSSPENCLEILALAQETWPDSDSVMAFKTLLQSCSSTWDSIYKLQKYGSFRGNSISCRNIIAIDSNLAFARERIQEWITPVAPFSATGDPELAEQIKTLVDREERCSDPVWGSCWLEASARCKELKLPVEIYASYAILEIRRRGHGHPGEWCPEGPEFPLAWSASRIDEELTKKAAPFYAKQRALCWQDAINNREFNCGVRLIRAVLLGQTEGFSSRTCLQCVANDLEYAPQLRELFPEWQGTVAELVEKTRGVAEATTEDLRTNAVIGGYLPLWNADMKCCPASLLSTELDEPLRELDHEREEWEAELNRQQHQKEERARILAEIERDFGPYSEEPVSPPSDITTDAQPSPAQMTATPSPAPERGEQNTVASSITGNDIVFQTV